jgi:hypothetical protein
MQVRQGQINFTTLMELPDGAPIMSGTFSIHHQPVVALFDSGATHSFISNNCGTRIRFDPCPTQGSYMISTPGGKITSNQMVKSVPIRLGSPVIKTDLVLLNFEGIDVILGTNWMTEHRVLLDISSRVLSPYFGRAKSGPRSKVGLGDNYGKLADRILYGCLGPVRPCKLRFR